jgi:hypothetical protein
MACASINIFTVRKQEWESFLALQRDQFIPLLRLQPGFLEFEITRTGSGSGVAILWWESEDARAAATPRLHEWVSRYIDPYLLTLDNPSGPVVLSTRRPEG